MRIPKNFNAQRLIRLFVAAVIVPLVVAPKPASAGLFNVDAWMANIRYTPAAGSITWLSSWELEASAASFDSASGHNHGYQSVTWSPGAAAMAAASSLTAYSAAGADVHVDAYGNMTQLHSFTQTSPASGLYASAFSCASAYREFMLTGGSGSVPVTFSFDYSASFSGTMDNPSQVGVGDWLGTIRISDGTSTWDLTAANRATVPPDVTFSGTALSTFLLRYGTPYSISFAKDTEVPEPSTVFAAVFLVAAILLYELRSWRRRIALACSASRPAEPEVGALFHTTNPNPRSSSGGLPMCCQSTPCRGRRSARIAGFQRRHGGILSLLAGAITLSPLPGTKQNHRVAGPTIL